MSEENKLVFTPQDFESGYLESIGTIPHTYKGLLELVSWAANKRFNQWLDKQVVVYRKEICDDTEKEYPVWVYAVNAEGATHTARLVNITKTEGDGK